MDNAFLKMLIRESEKHESFLATIDGEYERFVRSEIRDLVDNGLYSEAKKKVEDSYSSVKIGLNYKGEVVEEREFLWGKDIILGDLNKHEVSLENFKCVIQSENPEKLVYLAIEYQTLICMLDGCIEEEVSIRIDESLKFNDKDQTMEILNDLYNITPQNSESSNHSYYLFKDKILKS